MGDYLCDFVVCLGSWCALSVEGSPVGKGMLRIRYCRRVL